MARKLRVGIVGCGGIANAHLGGYQADGNVDIVAAYDPVRASAEAMAAKSGAAVAGSVEEMVLKHRPDAVSVCSPPAAHLENCRPFIEAGIAVLCEKPLEVNAARAAELARLAAGRTAPFMVAFCHRFHPPVIELKKLIDAGVLGTPLLFRNIFGGYSVGLEKNHRVNAAVSGGGPLIDHCCHSIDLFRHLVGDPTHAQAMAGNIMRDLPIEDFGMFHLTIGGKIFGEITGTYSLKGCGNSVEWYGTKGSAVISYFDPSKPELSYVADGMEKPVVVDVAGRPTRFAAETAHFLACVREGTRPAITAEDGLKANQVVAAVYASVGGARTAVAYTPA